MIYNQLFVRPTQNTLDYLSSAMSGSPLDLDLEAYRVEIITSLDAIEAYPDVVYDASAISVKVWYDTYLQRSSLILSMESSDLQKRCLDLNKHEVVRAFSDYYNPHLTLKPNMPALSRNYRTFILQTANVLCSSDQPLQFTGEYVTQADLLSPPDAAYNEAMIAERSVRRNT